MFVSTCNPRGGLGHAPLDFCCFHQCSCTIAQQLFFLGGGGGNTLVCTLVAIAIHYKNLRSNSIGANYTCTCTLAAIQFRNVASSEFAAIIVNSRLCSKRATYILLI